MAILKFIKRNGMNLPNAIQYISDECKTSRDYVFGILMGCSNPLLEFELIKKMAQVKDESKSFIHVVFSLDCADTLPLDTVLEICKSVGQLLSKDIYQVLGAIHYKNEAHIHCHYIINSIGLDYKRYEQGMSLWSYKQIINKIIEPYGISPILYYQGDEKGDLHKK